MTQLFSRESPTLSPPSASKISLARRKSALSELLLLFSGGCPAKPELCKGPLHLNEEVLEEVLPRPRRRAIFLVSAPLGLCRAAYDALRAEGHLEDAFFLDELPEAEAT